MSMYIDGKKVTAMYWGGRKIREAWYEGERVFSGKPVEVMPPTSGGYGARDWLRAKLTEYGESYRTVTEIPFGIDTGESSNLDYMFSGCSSLTTVPAMDTSQAVSMDYMFSDCSSLTTVPAMDTSQAVSMGYMFSGCSSLTTVPAMDTSSVTRMWYMFYGCSSLTDGNVRLIGRSRNVDTYEMITGSGLTREPFYDTSGRPI